MKAEINIHMQVNTQNLRFIFNSFPIPSHALALVC